jgi:HEAT repeat protein
MKWQNITIILLVSVFLLPACQQKCKPDKDPECWAEALKNPEKIEDAITNLKKLKYKKAEPALIEAFQAAANQPEHREKIADIFKKWKTKEAVKPLMAGLDFIVGSNKESRKAKRTNRANQKIASALAAIGDKQAIASLIRLMKSTKEPNVQRAAIRALGELKATESVEDLIKLAEDKAALRVIRNNAVFALGDIGDAKAIDTLILSLFREKAYFFAQANLALVKIGEPAIAPLVDTMMGKNTEAKRIHEQNVGVLKGAMEANTAKVLGDIGSPKAVAPLLKMSKVISKWEGDNRLIAMTRLINALGMIGDKKGLDVVLSYLEGATWDVRTVCANAINYISDRSATEKMLKILDKGGHPRELAPLIEAAGNLGTDEVLPKLKNLAKSHKDVTVQTYIKDSIARLKAYAECKQDLNCWIGKTKDSQIAVREKAAYELGRIGDPKAIEPLEKIINDPSENVRFAVIWAFDKLKAKKAIPTIEQLLENEKGSTRYKVVNHNFKMLLARLNQKG